MLMLDHLAVSAATLAEGVEYVEAVLGMRLASGGTHPHMATHNRLIRLGDLYLEVIAADPGIPRPTWPRWFDLDNFTGAPRLTNWVARCDNLLAEVRASPPGTGVPISLSRGNYHWDMAVPEDGCLPYDGAFPALIQWHGTAHPTQALPDSGMRLTRLEIAHPQAVTLRALLAPRLTDARVTIVQGAANALQATIETAQGPRLLT